MTPNEQLVEAAKNLMTTYCCNEWRTCSANHGPVFDAMKAAFLRVEAEPPAGRPQRIAEIRARLEKITPWPWEIRSAVPYGDGQVIFSGHWENNKTVARWNFHYGNTRNDIPFIAAAPEDIAWMLEFIDPLLDKMEAMEQAILSIAVALSINPGTAPPPNDTFALFRKCVSAAHAQRSELAALRAQNEGIIAVLHAELAENTEMNSDARAAMMKAVAALNETPQTDPEGPCQLCSGAVYCAPPAARKEE